jgi:hypothetical protein
MAAIRRDSGAFRSLSARCGAYRAASAGHLAPVDSFCDHTFSTCDHKLQKIGGKPRQHGKNHSSCRKVVALPLKHSNEGRIS